MKNTFALIAIVGIIAIAAVFGGCEGLALWQQGKYFHSEVSDSAAFKDIGTIGVYVFCDGETTLERQQVSSIGLADWPSSEVIPGATFNGDTANSGPTLELANAVTKELGDRGYNAKRVTDMTHNKEVTVDDCLKHAKANNYDGAFIVYYTGYSGSDAVEEFMNRLAGRPSNTSHHVGSYFYIPHGGFFQVSTGKELWKNSYYGLVQNAHGFNLSGEPYVMLGGDAVTENRDDTYIASAPKAAKQLLDPPHWPETAKNFPGRGERRHRM